MAATTIVFYGIKLEIGDDDLEALELRSHSKLLAARGAGLDYYWGNFAAPNEKYFLFIGKLLGKLGDEDQLEIQIASFDFDKVAESISEKLRRAGFSETALLHMNYQPDE